MKFLVDEQLPPFLARKLAESGYRAAHVTESPGLGSSDSEVVAWAEENLAAIITKDIHFVQRAALGLLAVPVIWVRFGNTANEELWMRFANEMPGVPASLGAGAQVIEIV